MLTIAGFHTLQKLYESDTSLVYRGYRASDQQPVILKVLKEAYPPPEIIAWFRREYEITQNLASDGVAAVHTMYREQQRWIMVVEDFGGKSLLELGLPGQMSLEAFLKLSLGITDILGKVHAKQVIHKDINPANIVLNPVTGQLKLIDFGIATVLSRENPSFRNPNVLEGTLAYMSPEQTGRMNRAMDYRTDFYSLGVTFYELLAGELPFVSEDALELVHSHIAKQPLPPHERNPSVPVAVSAIILKLMAKNAEDRYQSAYGLAADLEACLDQWQTTGQVVPFPLGEYDISDRFLIPQKLYGREQERATLLEAFERVSQGRAEVLLVSGYSGIGKSSLVQEIYKPITQKRGYFIAGKFDQLQRNTPYAAIIQAFRSLLRQLLTESEAELTAWREKMLHALGINGQVIIDVLPEVELILGLQPPVQELGPLETQNRFHLVLQNFIRVFCQPEHPLALFLDDLQWADAATLTLVELLLTDQHVGYLFLIGAYRDNEVDPAHPLLLTIEKIRETGAEINHITLTPLEQQHITQLIAETLHSDVQRVASLADLVMRKTQGNPFFVNQFLKTLYQERLLTFDERARHWQWNNSQIERVGITDNVVELTIGKVSSLPRATQQVLQLAACMGNAFDLPTLAIIYQHPVHETFADLLPALNEELVLPTSELEMAATESGDAALFVLHYRFLHDRVQQAAYALIDEEQRQAVHLQIGRLLLASLSESERDEKLFDLIHHLNLGRALLTDEAELLQLAHLNFEAGRKAKASTAYTSALQYLAVGMQCLTRQAWEVHYDLTLALHRAQAEVAYLSGDFEQSEALIMHALAQAHHPIEKAELYNILIVQYTMLARYEEALDAGRQALRLLDIDLPEENILVALEQELVAAKTNLRGRDITELLEAPAMTSAEKKMAVKLLTNIDPPAYFCNPDLYALVVVKMANLSLQYGHVPESAKSYGTYGIILGPRLGHYATGYEFTLLSLKLSERFHDLVQKCKACHNLSNHVSHWVRPLRSVTALREEGFKAGVEGGELQHAGYILMYGVFARFYQGENLERILEEIQRCLFFTQKTRNQWATDGIIACQMAILNLQEKTPSLTDFRTDTMSEAAYLERCEQSLSTRCIYLIFKAQVLYLYRRSNEALVCILESEKLLGFIVGIFSVAEHCFFHSLILTDLYGTATLVEQERYWEQLEANLRQMKLWADNCSENFLHMFLLIAAEMAALVGKHEAAMDLYDQAIDAAKDQGCLQHEALANELAARFWLKRGKVAFAQVYMRKAFYGYRLWGARRKLATLEEQVPALLIEAQEQRNMDSTRMTTRTTTRATTTSTASDALDLSSIMKAAQAMSGDIVLDSLLSKLMTILIENAGAQRGLIILEREGQWVIEAEGGIDQQEITVLQSVAVGGAHTALLPKTIINYVLRTHENVVLSDASAEGPFTQDAYIRTNHPKSILCAPLLHQGKLSGVIYLENNLTTDAFTEDRIRVLSLLSTQAAISIENARLYDYQVTLTKAYSRFVPTEILHFLGKESIIHVQLGDQTQQTMTVLFSDIRSFTTLSEQMTPQENFNFINAYLSRVSPVIRQNHGFIDKYIGDAVMALFSRSADDALQASIGIQREVARYNVRRKARGYQPIRIGVGLHTGSVMLGTVGEAERMEGTVISDAVNLASRLEGSTKRYRAAIIISEDTLFHLEQREQYHIRYIDRVRVKGKKGAVSIFEVLDGCTDEVLVTRLQTLSDFESGIHLYQYQDFYQAAELFQRVLEVDPEDRVAFLYRQRALHFAEHGVPAHWDGIEELTEK